MDFIAIIFVPTVFALIHCFLTSETHNVCETVYPLTNLTDPPALYRLDSSIKCEFFTCNISFCITMEVFSFASSTPVLFSIETKECIFFKALIVTLHCNLHFG